MSKLKSLLVVFVLAAIMTGQAWTPGLAQDPGPELPEPETLPLQVPEALVKDPEHEYFLSEAQLLEQPQAGSDSFGYSWTDSSAAPGLYGWLDAKGGGSQVSFEGKDKDSSYSDPINIGFSFKFYENSYTQLFASTNGLISFGNGTDISTNTPLGKNPPPNNIIAAFWDDLELGDGGIYTLTGTDPVRGKFLVVEWNSIRKISDSSALLTFQAVLYQTGDVKLQYATMTGDVSSASVGIEDPDGLVGLQYLYNQPGLAAGRAVLFTRPQPDARVKLLARHFGGFVEGGEASVLLEVRNTGELGADTINLATGNLSSPGWVTAFFDSSGANPLRDTNGDGKVDTGVVDQGKTFKFMLHVQSPDGANSGDFASFNLTASSSRKPAAQQSMSLQFAVPAPFSQFYADSEEGIGLDQISAYQRRTMITEPSFTGSSLALASQSTGGLVGIWEQNEVEPSVSFLSQTSLKFAWISPLGELVRTQAPLTDNLQAGTSMFVMVTDQSMGLAVGDGGDVGVVWLRAETDYDYITPSPNVLGTRRNIFFNWIDSRGEKGQAAEIPLTSSSAWVKSDQYNLPELASPRITYLGSGKYWIVWVEEIRQSDKVMVTSIYGGLYQLNGKSFSVVKQPVRLIASKAGQTIFEDLNLVPLSGGRTLLLYAEKNVSTGDYAVVSTVFNANGDRVYGPTPVPGATGWEADAEQLGSGNILLAWTHENGGKGDGLRYTLLNGTSYAPILGSPVMLLAQSDHAQDHLSVIREPGGRGVITWVDIEGGDYLFYALVGKNGELITPPMIFYPRQLGNSILSTNQSGQGSAFYDPRFQVYLPATMR